MEVLRKIRRTDEVIPIILLTARDEVHDKVSGLDLGANDYITKPFQIEELLARIRVHLRQRAANGVQSEELTVGDLSVDIDTREVKRAEKNIDRKSTRLNSSHVTISYAVFCLKKKKII